MTGGGVAAAEPALLAQLERAQALGFLGPGPVAAHIEHARAFVAALDGVTGRVADLGSGAGVPGLPVAVARPDLELVLLEAGERRARFLGEAVEALALGDRVSVVHGRAEQLGRGPLRGSVDAVVARGFGAPAVTAECAAPLLRLGGRLVVSEPPTSSDRWPGDGLAVLGLAVGPRLRVGAQIQVLHQVEPCPEAYPRRDGVPGKRPLF